LVVVIRIVRPTTPAAMREVRVERCRRQKCLRMALLGSGLVW
jgi:hypothetical protein